MYGLLLSQYIMEGYGMFIEGKSIQELRALVNEKGYFSVEANRICKEIEASKREYEYLIKMQDKMPGWNQEAESVINYYLYQLEQLKYRIPYDDMSCQLTVPILILDEFQKDDIADRIKAYIDVGAGLDETKLGMEIQKFLTVQLDPRGIILYMDILSHGSFREKCHAGNGV